MTVNYALLRPAPSAVAHLPRRPYNRDMTFAAVREAAARAAAAVFACAPERVIVSIERLRGPTPDRELSPACRAARAAAAVLLACSPEALLVTVRRRRGRAAPT
jgi:hypothetical protein